MPIRDGAVIRRERIRMIFQLIKSNPGIKISKIQADIAWRTGLTPKTISNYVQELVELQKLKEIDQGFTVRTRA